MQKTPDGLGWISTADATRETLGTQVIRAEENFANAPVAQEAGETMTELGKTICKGLEDAINNARSKNIRGRIYIHIVENELPPLLGKTGMQLVFFTRRTRPTPIWNTCLYRHDEDDSQPYLEWALPQYQHTRQMLANIYSYSPDHINWVQKMLKGLLT